MIWGVVYMMIEGKRFCLCFCLLFGFGLFLSINLFAVYQFFDCCLSILFLPINLPVNKYIYSTICGSIKSLSKICINFHLGSSFGFSNIWLNALSFSGPLTSSSCNGIKVMWKSSYNSTIWSRYFFCIFDLALHILHSSSGYKSWLMTMFLISMLKLANSWIRRSV